MDLMKTEYEFLDLTDAKKADLDDIKLMLFEKKSIAILAAKHKHLGRLQLNIDQTKVSASSKEGQLTLVNTVANLSGAEGEMAPHSPARGSAGQPSHPPAYTQPPPAYPPSHHQWPVAPPNVYVSQVTANVNVHGYMGQYYQPPTPQYAPAPQERVPRTHRRDRRTKRQPSPPSHPAQPYYVQYPQYYQAAQAQGAPLYHLPVYQPLVYGPYTYPQYYPEYPLPVEGEADKGPEEYPPEVVMEQEPVDAYYASAHYVGPSYGPPVDGTIEYVPQMYLPPPHHPQPVQPAPHHHPIPHQFNVHAKNFVQGQGRSYNVPNDKVTERRSPPPAASTSTAAPAVEALPVKDLKISSKGPGSPKHNDRPADVVQSKPAPSPTEKSTPKVEQKSTVMPEKSETTVIPAAQTPRTFPPLTTTGPSPVSANKIPPTINKPTKGPTAPFSSGKQPPKPSTSQTIVSAQQTVTTPKAPFGNRQKRDGTSNRSPSNEISETPDRSISGNEHAKREPPLPPSKAPMPISINLHAAGQPLIVASKPPFGHSRKAMNIPEPPPVPQPPPPAPTASDFPPPPTPRNRTEPPPVVQPQPQPAPGKSWASLFSAKPAPTPAPAQIAPPVSTTEEPASPTTNVPPVMSNVQKPVAKVPPYDASPLSGAASEKPQPGSAAPVVSYSEKTSVNAISGANTATGSPKSTASNQSANEVREVPVARETNIALPAPSPFCDDPNSYRMGEFLTKYQLDNRSVSILPRGLTNRSNYCYVNAILQALIACPPFYNLLKALPYQTRRGKSSTPLIDSMVELCYEFSPAGTSVRGARGGSGAGYAGAAPIVPGGPPLEGSAGLRILRALRPFPGSQEGRQEDAEEFLGCLLNSLNDEMLELMKLVEPEEPKEGNVQPNGISSAEQSVEENDDDEWKVMGPRNRGAVERRWAARRTPVADIFRGSTRVRLHRAHHHDVTDAVQPFFTLQLDIERASNVKDALELLSGKDTLEGVNDAWQQLSLEELPVALLLHLKCFQFDQDGHTAKIVKNIEFPIDLKIDPKVMSSKQKYTTKQRLYKLFAVVYHEGVEAVKGHYVTDTYHGLAGWLRYDDSTVTQVSDSQVLKPKPPRMPYLLMYRRLDTLPPSHHRSPPKSE